MEFNTGNGQTNATEQSSSED
uniref:Uncharacterized protein n=1 Tax=Anguilla anguilla TaxID=7936 RepID=A0A0E9UG25_ANGAN